VGSTNATVKQEMTAHQAVLTVMLLTVAVAFVVQEQTHHLSIKRANLLAGGPVNGMVPLEKRTTFMTLEMYL
jgi:hypothetical protein